MTPPFIVVIAGGTASGKTTAARTVSARLGALRIEHDRYYKDVAQPRGHNYDHPHALDTDRLVDDLSRLREGKPAGLPVYDFPTHRRRPEVETVLPSPIILVEGILTLADPRIRDLSDLRVFVDAPADIRLVRRIRRDVVERGRDVAGVLEQYLATVRPMHEAYVAPSVAHAHLVLHGTDPEEVIVDGILAAIDQMRSASRVP